MDGTYLCANDADTALLLVSTSSLADCSNVVSNKSVLARTLFNSRGFPCGKDGAPPGEGSACTDDPALCDKAS